MSLRSLALRCLFTCLICLPPAHADNGDELQLARDAYRNRDLDRIARQVERLSGSPLEPYPRYWLASAQLIAGDDSAVSPYLQQYAGSYLADKLRSEWLKELAKRGDWARFESEYPKGVDAATDSELTCWRLQGRLLAGDMAALRQQRQLWFSPAGQPDPCIPVFDALFASGALTEDAIWQRLRLVLTANNFDFAKKLLQRLSEPQGLDDKLLQQVAAAPGKWLLRLDPRQRGERELLLYALERQARSDPDAAAQTLAAIQERLPAAERDYAWGRVAYQAARKLHPSARNWFLKAKDAALDDDALEWMARAALRSGDWSLLQRAVGKLSQPKREEAVWRYWRARALKEQGKAVEANQLFAPLSNEHHFYGLLAREELGTYVDTTLGRYKSNGDDLKAAQNDPGLQRALALSRIKWRTEAVREWNWEMRSLNDRQLLAAAELAMSEHWYDRAIYSAERTRELHDFSLRYITPYRDVTEYYAQAMDLDAAWVFGLIRQESRFVTVARSGVGAQGLMQLMPGTALMMARKLGLKHLQPAAVNEVGTNVQLGTYYLKTVLGQLGNHPVLATAAYNAGPGRARAWQGDAALEGAVYAESIPFSETRDYVKKVMANALYYSQSLGGARLSLKQRLGVIPARGGAVDMINADAEPPAGQ